MNNSDLALLRECITTTQDLVGPGRQQLGVRFLHGKGQKVVRLFFADGEVVVARVFGVDLQAEEIMYDVLSSTANSKYQRRGDVAEASYVARFDEVAAVEAVKDSDPAEDYSRK